MTMKKAVAKTTQRRLALQKQLVQVAQIEAEQRVRVDVESDPQYRKLTAELKEVADQLHRKRVIVSRKDFAIGVREQRLEKIPTEIKTIKEERSTVVKEVTGLESRETAIHQSIESIKKRVADKLKQQHSDLALAVPA